VTSPAPRTLALSWVAPSDPRDLVGYEITVSRAGVEVFTSGAAADATTTTLAAPEVDIIDGVEHSVAIRAVNAVGRSDPSEVASATPLGLPGVPTEVSAVARPDGLDVSFDAPVDTGGSPLLQADLVATPIGGGAPVAVTVPWGVTPLTVTMTTVDGLLLDTEYEVSVTVHNAVGPGPAAISNAVVPGRPGAPRDVVASSRVGGAHVVWEVPLSDGGLPVQSYVVTAYVAGTRISVSEAVVAGELREVSLGDLSDGTVYDIEVRASQDLDGLTGLGARSVTTSVLVGRPMPTAGVTLTRSAPGTLTITWPAVSDAPGLAVIGYEVRLEDGSTVTVFSSSCDNATCSSVRSGLVNGRQYVVQVAALSAAGAGPWSQAVNATPRTVPGQPVALALEPANGALSMAFDPPVDNGGDDIDGFLVEVVPAAGGASVWSGTLGALETSVSIENLSNGVSYSVSVRARNGAGTSTPRTATATPATTPGAPRNIRARPGSIVVEWDAPFDTGGNAITAYEITVTDAEGISTTVLTSGLATCSTTLRYCRITQVYTSSSPETLVAVPADMEYTITVAAVNAQGPGDSSDEVILIAAQPSEPVNVLATAGRESLAVCWESPQYLPGAAPVTAYRLSFVAGGESMELVVPVDSLDPAPSCDAPSVGHVVTVFDDGSRPTAGTTYSVQVAASVSTGDYVFGVLSASSSATPYTFPGAPATVSATATGLSVTVTWAAASGGGAEVVEYTVTASPGGEQCTWTSGPLECTITGLVHDLTYAFEVIATNVAGDGPAIQTAAITVDGVGPAATWNSVLKVDDDTVQWRVDFDEQVTGLTIGAFSTPVGNDCAVALDAVEPTSALVSLTCAPGEAILRLAAGSVVDLNGNAGPAVAVDASPVTFAEATTSEEDPEPPPPTDDPIEPPNPPVTPETPSTPRTPSAPNTPITPSPPSTPRIDVAFPLVVGGVCVRICEGVAKSTVMLRVGATLEVRGGGLAPGSQVEAWLYSQPRFVGRLHVDVDGFVDGAFVIPDIEPGNHTLELTGLDAGGERFVVQMDALIESTELTLPTTGHDPERPMSLALLLLAVGLLAQLLRPHRLRRS